MKTFVIYILILLAAIAVSAGDALSQVDYNGTPDFNAEYAPSGMQFSEDGFDINKGISRKKWKKMWEKQKKMKEKEAKKKKKKAEKDSTSAIRRAEKDAADAEKALQKEASNAAKSERDKEKAEMRAATEAEKAAARKAKYDKKHPKEVDEDYDPEITDFDDFGKEGESLEFEDGRPEVKQEVVQTEDKKKQKEKN